MSPTGTKMQDDDEIPLLDDVVKPGDLSAEPISGLYDEADTEPGGYEEILEVLREGVAAQLNTELQPLVDTAIENAVEQITERFAQNLRDELRGSLEERLRQLIDEAVQKAFVAR